MSDQVQTGVSSAAALNARADESQSVADAEWKLGVLAERKQIERSFRTEYFATEKAKLILGVADPHCQHQSYHDYQVARIHRNDLERRLEEASNGRAEAQRMVNRLSAELGVDTGLLPIDDQQFNEWSIEIATEVRERLVTMLNGERFVTPDDWITPGTEDGPDRIWSSRPELQHLMNVAKTMKLSPWALLGQVLTRAAASIPYWVHFRSFLGRRPVNLLVAVAGSTGTGKTAAESAAADVFLWPRDLGLVLEAGSGEAIPSAYAFAAAKADTETGTQKGDLVWRHEDHLARFGFDEVGRLNAVQGRQGATVLEYLKSAESGAALGRILASGEGVQLPAKEYRFTATINIQPERAHLITSADEAAGGLPGRMLWVNAEYAPFVGMRRRRERIAPYPLSRLDWTLTDAIDALDVMEDAFEAQQDAALAGELDPMESHSALLRAKVACCLMVLAGRQALIDDDWDIAGAILENSRTVRMDVLKTVVNSEDELRPGDRVKDMRVRATMGAHRSAGLTHGAARKKLSSRDRRVWDNAVARGDAEAW